MHPVVKKLLGEPIIEQRTEAWFALRKDVLSASNVGQALGVNKYSTADTLVAKYCGFKEEFSEFGKRAVAHGNKYEREILELHQELLGEKVYEFGLKRHDVHEWLGGSPDGISESGILCEYKAPISRKLEHGKVPEHYMCQVQMLLEVFDLEKAEYLEYRPKELTFPDPPELNRVFITRDRDWFAKSFPVLRAFWDKVLDYRTRGDEWKQLLPPALRRQVGETFNVAERLQDIRRILDEIEKHLSGTTTPPPAPAPAADPPARVKVDSRIDATLGGADPTLRALQLPDTS